MRAAPPPRLAGAERALGALRPLLDDPACARGALLRPLEGAERALGALVRPRDGATLGVLRPPREGAAWAPDAPSRLRDGAARLGALRSDGLPPARASGTRADGARSRTALDGSALRLSPPARADGLALEPLALGVRPEVTGSLRPGATAAPPRPDAAPDSSPPRSRADGRSPAAAPLVRPDELALGRDPLALPAADEPRALGRSPPAAGAADDPLALGRSLPAAGAACARPALDSAALRAAPPIRSEGRVVLAPVPAGAVLAARRPTDVAAVGRPSA